MERTRPFGALAEALDCQPDSPDPRGGHSRPLGHQQPRRHRRQPIAAAQTPTVSRATGGSGPVTVTSDAGLQFRVVDALVDLVEGLALQTPLVIAVDDLQWVDPSSLLTIAAIGRRFSFMPVALIVCFRPGPDRAQFRQVIDALTRSGATELGVGRLDEPAVEALVSELVAGRAGPTLLGEIAGAGGNPLFITELLAAIEADGILQETTGGST